MTIVHISSSLGGGGAEQMVLQLSKESNAQHKTIVFSISNVNTLEEQFSIFGIECHFLDISSFKHKSLLRGLKKMHSIIKDMEDIVLHCHQYHGGLLGMLYKLFYIKAPIVFTLHSTKTDSFLRDMLLYSTKFLRNKDITFSPNPKQWYLKGRTIIPNGIDFKQVSTNYKRQFNNSNESIFYILYLGRLSNEKNPLAMPQIALQLLEKGVHNFRFLVVGDGAQKKELEQIIENHNLKNYFQLFGFQSSIDKYLNQAHCLIVPSLWEGMPVVIIEAGATKLPILSTPVGSIPDILNSSTGYLEDVENFHLTLSQMINNYSEAIEKSELFYNYVKTNMNIQSVYEQHLKVYSAVLPKKTK